MTEQNTSVELNCNLIEDLSSGTELENNPVMAMASDSLPIGVSNANLVENSSACGKCNGANEKVNRNPTYVWAYGRIKSRFTDECINREFKNAVKKVNTNGLDDAQVMYEVLKRPENRYLLRKICWVLQISGIDVYVLLPTDIQDYSLLIEAINPSSSAGEILVDIVIGTRGPIADLSICNCLPLPIVFYDRVYSFNMGQMINGIIEEIITRRNESRALNTDDENALRKATADLFTMIVFSAMDNAGGTDEHRAMNYMLTDPNVYISVKAAFDSDKSLESITARPAEVSGVRKIVDVIFTYRSRKNDAIYQELVRVDVTCEFPFIVFEPTRTITF